MQMHSILHLACLPQFCKHSYLGMQKGGLKIILILNMSVANWVMLTGQMVTNLLPNCDSCLMSRKIYYIDEYWHEYNL